MSVRFVCPKCGYKAVSNDAKVCPLCEYEKYKDNSYINKDANLPSIDAYGYNAQNINKSSALGKHDNNGCVAILVKIILILIFICLIVTFLVGSGILDGTISFIIIVGILWLVLKVKK